MTCAVCGSEAVAGARFCAACGAPLVGSCPDCGSDTPAGARFCPGCGTSLIAAEAAVAEERKLISVVFCDLAGFTSDASNADPEEIAGRLTRYHARVREDVERFGGRVEKLMGDGVLAVFGAPAAHEDDPERAVRAALRVQRSVGDLNASDPALSLRVRAAVTTGEAMVQLADAPDREGIVGDVVNTASRLQAFAPIGGVVVDTRTYHATRHAVAYQPLDPVEVRGKAGEVPLWQAVEAHGPGGPAELGSGGRLVGRDHELGLLTEAFERAVARSVPQLVTIVGEPGVGKSRLVQELYRWVDERPDLVWWRQGRCLPYGEGVTFWALGEVVKSHAGILEAEPPDQVASKLEAAVSALVEDPSEAEWLRLRLAPLVGLEGMAVERGELFRAWQRFFDALAARDPLVLVIEDLHWADDALVAFLTYLLDESADLPLLVVCTGRPELLIRRPGWGGGRRDAVTIGLSPLSPEETLTLVGVLSERPVPAATQRALLDRSGGNPLYLTEYVRLASQRGLLDRLGDQDIPMPDTLQALISARIDLLEGEDKALLQAAAVMGKVFWTGALAYLRGVDSDRVRGALRRMTQRELIRPVKRSSTLGQEEYTFGHVLVRDVAYQQIPRRERAALHEAVGRWLEAKAGDRIPEVAEHLAHHYTTSDELRPEKDPGLRARAHRFLMMAGERAESLDAARAAQLYRRAGEVAATPLERGPALLGQARTHFEDADRAQQLVQQALDEFIAAGDPVKRVEALTYRGFLEWLRGQADQADATSEELLRLVDGMEPSHAVAEALVGVAGNRQLRGREEEALDVVERALAVAQQVGSTEVFGRALVIRGSARIQMGEFEAERDVTEALRIFLDRNFTHRAMQAYNNCATYLIVRGELEAGRQVIDESIEYGSARGYPAHVDWSRNTRCEALFPLGEWDELLETARAVEEADAARGGSQLGAFARRWRAVVLFQRGQVDEAREMFEAVVTEARRIADPQVLVPAIASAIEVLLVAGNRDEASRLADELAPLVPSHPVFSAVHLPEAAVALIELGRAEQLEALAASVQTGGAPFLEAQRAWIGGLLADHRGDPEAALDGYRQVWEVGDPLSQRYWSAVARVDAAGAARSLGRHRQAETWLAEAKASAERMGAVRLLTRIEHLASDLSKASG